MNNWAQTLPVVTVSQGDQPKAVTLVLPYYENPCFLEKQVDHWRVYPKDLRAALSIIVVDDGSPEPARKPDLPNCRLFRIDVDRRWNWLAARNIGAHHAADGWLILTDMDHVMPESTLRAVVYGQHDPRTIYAFARKEHTGETIQPHSASFLLTRQTFWMIGGYDEALSGYYGTDGDFRRRARLVRPFARLTDHLVRYEYVADASTTRYLRKQPEDTTVARLVGARGTRWTPKTLSFPYHEVTA